MRERDALARKDTYLKTKNSEAGWQGMKAEGNEKISGLSDTCLKHENKATGKRRWRTWTAAEWVFFLPEHVFYYEEKRHHLSKRDKNALGSCPVSQETAWVHNQDWISTQPSCSDTKYPWHFSWHGALICDRIDSIYKQFMKPNALFKTLAGGLAFQTAASTFWFLINYSSAKFWTYAMPIKKSRFYLANCINGICYRKLFTSVWKF